MMGLKYSSNFQILHVHMRSAFEFCLTIAYVEQLSKRSSGVACTDEKQIRQCASGGNVHGQQSVEAFVDGSEARKERLFSGRDEMQVLEFQSQFVQSSCLRNLEWRTEIVYIMLRM